MLLRSVVLSYGGSHGLLKDVIAEATRQFHAHREDEQVHAPSCLTGLPLLLRLLPLLPSTTTNAWCHLIAQGSPIHPDLLTLVYNLAVKYVAATYLWALVDVDQQTSLIGCLSPHQVRRGEGVGGHARDLPQPQVAGAKDPRHQRPRQGFVRLPQLGRPNFIFVGAETGPKLVG
jgi:hypothetical protein